jgi:ketosteroid isomerase-like protein
MRILWCAALWMAVVGGAGMQAADSGEEKAIVAAIQKVFDGMAAHDPGMIRSVMMDDARLTAIRGDRPAASLSVEQFLKGIEGNQSKLLERMWDPKVMVRGRLAAVWAEYDFHSDGKFGHCGVDSFLMVKTADGWKISSIAWTAETEGCAPSPLGPPK